MATNPQEKNWNLVELLWVHIHVVRKLVSSANLNSCPQVSGPLASLSSGIEQSLSQTVPLLFTTQQRGLKPHHLRTLLLQAMYSIWFTYLRHKYELWWDTTSPVSRLSLTQLHTGWNWDIQHNSMGNREIGPVWLCVEQRLLFTANPPPSPPICARTVCKNHRSQFCVHARLGVEA